MIIEFFLALFLILLLRLLDGWVERPRDALHCVTKPSIARAALPADLSGRARAFYRGREEKLIAQQRQRNPANEGQSAGRYNGDAGEHYDRRPRAWNGLLLHRFAFVLVPENEFGISEQEPKPDRRHDNQADHRDEIPKAVLRHRQTISWPHNAATKLAR
jgi:hypothetical protein